MNSKNYIHDDDDNIMDNNNINHDNNIDNDNDN